MIKIVISLFILMLSCTVAQAADNTEYSPELYLSPFIGFETLKTEDISVPTPALCIYSDSGELSKKIGALTLPLNSTEKPISYSADSPHITVSEDGTVTSDGTECTASVSISSGDISIDYPVYVTKSLSRFSLSESELNLYADKPEITTLSIITEPSAIDPALIKWHSGDEAIAYVDDTGRVIPNGVGTTSIYAETLDGQHTAKCTVYVGLYDVRTKAVFITNAIDKLRSGSEYTLSAYIYPETVNDKSVHWTSSNSNVVSISQDGTIHGIEPGNAVIKVESSNGKTDSFEIEILPSGSSEVNYKVISGSVSERVAELLSKPQFVSYDYTLDEMAEHQMAYSPVKYSENRRAEKSEVLDALDPSAHNGGYGKYQFIDLSESNNVSVDTLNSYLNGKGILSGKGQQFKDAAAAYGISELYLVTHACLETGDGFSQLANGVEVNGAVVYNMFGIGAYDENAVKYGSEYAYSMGWTSVDAAIYGGAAWISDNYINNASYKQNTLYKMRWNPDSPGEHQYATDIDWATAQAKTLKSMFDAFPDAELYFEVPLYKGEKEFEFK